jgi:peptidoglycan lytic transglycosylase G
VAFGSVVGFAVPRPSRRSIAFAFAVAVAAIAATTSTTRPAAGAADPTLRIVFPEGFSVRQMVDRVAEVRRIAIRKRHVTPRLTGGDYAAAARRTTVPRPFVRYLGRRSIDGFLFPATYEFTATSSAEELLASQVAAFARAWRTVDLRPARSRGRTPYDVLTVASMVERETVAPEERRLVAAVIYNRLDKDMPLAIDATLRYGLGIPGTRPLRRSQLESDSPYNTRRFKGLPPTPIGNPGLASIRAAAKPADVDYLYYVRKLDKVHHFFTADEEEFCRKAREYGYRC